MKISAPMPRTPSRWFALAASLGILAASAAARADVKQECVAAYEKTQTLRDQGKLLDARKQAVVCSAPACPSQAIKDCVQWLAAIDASLPTVVLMALDPAGAETLDVRVTVDGQALAAKLDGKAVALDPGQHVLRFEMAGAEAVEQKAASSSPAPAQPWAPTPWASPRRA